MDTLAGRMLNNTRPWSHGFHLKNHPQHSVTDESANAHASIYSKQVGHIKLLLYYRSDWCNTSQAVALNCVTGWLTRFHFSCHHLNSIAHRFSCQKYQWKKQKASHKRQWVMMFIMCNLILMKCQLIGFLWSIAGTTLTVKPDHITLKRVSTLHSHRNKLCLLFIQFYKAAHATYTCSIKEKRRCSRQQLMPWFELKTILRERHSTLGRASLLCGRSCQLKIANIAKPGTRWCQVIIQAHKPAWLVSQLVS